MVNEAISSTNLKGRSFGTQKHEATALCDFSCPNPFLSRNAQVIYVERRSTRVKFIAHCIYDSQHFPDQPLSVMYEGLGACVA